MERRCAAEGRGGVNSRGLAWPGAMAWLQESAVGREVQRGMKLDMGMGMGMDQNRAAKAVVAQVRQTPRTAAYALPIHESEQIPHLSFLD